MNLYERDYNVILNEDERNALVEELSYENKPGIKNTSKYPRFSHPKEEVRRFIWHKISFFPNNHLNRFEVINLNHGQEKESFKKVIYSAKNENEIQRYIKENRKWFIPGSIYREYNFGHHDAYLFPEQSLGAEYIADYMLLGKNSDGYSLVIVEFEKANVEFMLRSSNSESESVRKGITQIRDWKRWLDDNRNYFLNSSGLRDKGIDVPTTRIYYCLVVSRRDLMSQKAKDLRSQMIYENQNLKIISYDRLLDNILQLKNGY
ncbi:Shedu anti-phage system protein SduA domain-containing protein [Lachnoclostridium phytofermentans]|uniref:Shedu anti-phage system protein SduA domain-containing protein n=1 Tax=Lachnoclostridium phytofermentans TaxID=66219 RepID=UPI000495A355|nr:Shedu anti-phage system protein SduA domain-containing protein [Lachnoclostridium phytofermentans]